MSFISRWLNLAKGRQAVGLRPHRDLVVNAGYDAAYETVLDAIERVLGAYVSVNDRNSGTIEAAFGTVDNERVRSTLESLGERATRVRVEAYFPAGATPRPRSRAVDALANYLESLSKPV